MQVILVLKYLKVFLTLVSLQSPWNILFKVGTPALGPLSNLGND